MAVAYTFDTQASLPGQLSSSGLDSVTAAQITDFLASNGVFTTGDNKASVETTTNYDYVDPTKGADVYITTSNFIEMGAALNNGETLPSASAIVMNGGADSLSIVNDLGNNYFIATGADNDWVSIGAGSTGNDTIATGDGNDQVYLAGTGDHTVTAGAGIDTIYAYDGKNTIDLTEAASSVTATDSAGIKYANLVELNGGQNTVTGSNNGDLYNIFGGSNSITAGDGNDSFTVKTDLAQTLDGGNGTNYFNVTTSDANLTLVGGTGKDEYNLSATTGSVSITGSAGGDVLNIDASKYTSVASQTTNGDGSVTYTFGTGGSHLDVTVSNPGDVSLHFKNF